MKMRWLHWRLPAYALFALLCLIAEAQASTLLILSDRSPVYLDFANAYVRETATSGPASSIKVVYFHELTDTQLANAQLLIPIGTAAAEALALQADKVPLLLSLTPRSIFERIKSVRPLTTAIFIDQPASRYLNLIKEALPETKQIGFLYGKDSKDLMSALHSSAREKGLRASSASIAHENEIFPAIQQLFPEGGVLLATPDGNLFNPQTIPSILLSAYRRQVPVVGYSPAYINAGAVLALYSTPEQLARQAAEVGRSILSGAPLPPARYPRYFSVASNERVARSLGLTLENPASIKTRLEKLERQP